MTSRSSGTSSRTRYVYSSRRPMNCATNAISEPTASGGLVRHSTDVMFPYHSGAFAGSTAKAATSARGRAITRSTLTSTIANAPRGGWVRRSRRGGGGPLAGARRLDVAADPAAVGRRLLGVHPAPEPDRVRSERFPAPRGQLDDLVEVGMPRQLVTMGVEERGEDGEVVVVAEQLAEPVGLVDVRPHDGLPGVAQEPLVVPEVLDALAPFVHHLRIGRAACPCEALASARIGSRGALADRRPADVVDRPGRHVRGELGQIGTGAVDPRVGVRDGGELRDVAAEGGEPARGKLADVAVRQRVDRLREDVGV